MVRMKLKVWLFQVLQQRPIDSEATLRIGGFGNVGVGKRNCFRGGSLCFLSFFFIVLL